jgi:hypothetical protein
MLYDTGVAVRRNLGNAGARRRQQSLVETVLQAFMKTVVPPDEHHRLLDEIQACVRVHLQRLRGSCSPRGLWHVFLRRIASRRIEDILGRLRAEAGAAGSGNGQ